MKFQDKGGGVHEVDYKTSLDAILHLRLDKSSFVIDWGMGGGRFLSVLRLHVGQVCMPSAISSLAHMTTQACGIDVPSVINSVLAPDVIPPPLKACHLIGADIKDVRESMITTEIRMATHFIANIGLTDGVLLTLSFKYFICSHTFVLVDYYIIRLLPLFPHLRMLTFRAYRGNFEKDISGFLATAGFNYSVDHSFTFQSNKSKMSASAITFVRNMNSKWIDKCILILIFYSSTAAS